MRVVCFRQKLLSVTRFFINNTFVSIYRLVLFPELQMLETNLSRLQQWTGNAIQRTAQTVMRARVRVHLYSSVETVRLNTVRTCTAVQLFLPPTGLFLWAYYVKTSVSPCERLPGEFSPSMWPPVDLQLSGHSLHSLAPNFIPLLRYYKFGLTFVVSPRMS